MSSASIWAPGSNNIPVANPDSRLVREEFTATAGQSLFTLQTFSYTVNSAAIEVYVNGVKQAGSVIVETSTTSFTITNGVEEGDLVEVIGNTALIDPSGAATAAAASAAAAAASASAAATSATNSANSAATGAATTAANAAAALASQNAAAASATAAANSAIQAGLYSRPVWTVRDHTQTGFTAVNGESYQLNSSGGAFQFNPPVGPVKDDYINFMDLKDTWGTNKVTIKYVTDKINGAASDFDLDVSGYSGGMVYVDATIGWKVK